jgi:transposase-like protein
VIITKAVRWYCQFRLSLVNMRDLLAERGIDDSAPPILRWVHTFARLAISQLRAE